MQGLALTVVSIGVAVATVTDLQFHVFGACVALAWIIPSAVNKILWSRLQQQENWTALAYVIYNTLKFSISFPYPRTSPKVDLHQKTPIFFFLFFILPNLWID